MTISETTNRNSFDGDGVTVLFPYTFEIDTDDGSDIVLFVVDDEGNVTQLTGNYTIDVANARISYPTVAGVTPLEPGVTALPAGWELIALRIEPISQTVQLTEQGPYSGVALMAGLDKTIMICQQLQEQINRCFKVGVNETIASEDLSAFLAAITSRFPPMSVDTMDNLKLLSAGAPTTKRWGVVTDYNKQLAFYTADTNVGDAGWILIPIASLGA